MSTPRGRSKAFRSAGESKAGVRHRPTERSSSVDGRPTWQSVEALIEVLAQTHDTFASTMSPANWIAAYEPRRRLMVRAETRSSWVRVDHIRSCWETFERRGRISRRDVLEPGRHSAFMMALFAQLPGVREVPGDEPSLVLSRARAASPALAED
jgi:hypothetical protein